MLSEKEIISYIDEMKQTKRWEWNGKTALVLSGIWNLYEVSKDPVCRNLVKGAMDQLVQNLKEQGSGMISCEVLGCGRNLFPLYREQQDETYKAAAGELWQWLQNQNIFQEEMWTEKLYLTEPFCLEYENQFREKEGYHQIQKQLADAAQMAQEQLAGMDQAQAGFYLMALADSSSLISEEVFDHYKNAERYFKNGLKLTGYKTSSYAVYSILKGCRLGALLPEKYQKAAEQALIEDGVLTDDNAGIMMMAYGEYAKLQGKTILCALSDPKAAKAAE